MTEELLPESIRGGWYFVPADAEVEEGLGDDAEILVFRLDGTFTRFEIEGEERTESERGDYTFDGQFLIVRGSSTNTYRVEPEATWRWALEGKKSKKLLLRGLVDRKEPFELGPERADEIERMPMRVFVRSIFEGDTAGEICTMVHESDNEELELGALFAEPQDDAELWIGLTPFVEGLSVETWERIVRESYLDIYRDATGGIARVTLHVFGPGQTKNIEF